MNVSGDFIFSSESVTPGHPDKLCDQISDAIVDRLLLQEPDARAETESAVATGILFIAARMAPAVSLDIPGIAREVIAETGYRGGDFNAAECTVMTTLGELAVPESPAEACARREDPARAGMTEAERELACTPARQMTNVFGYACDHNPAMMPMPLWLARKLSRRLGQPGGEPWLPGPDGKTQVAVEFRAGRPHRLHSLTLVASQRDPATSPARLKRFLLEHVLTPSFEDEALKPDAATRVFVNPDGPLGSGGPRLHSGLTGRKNAADTYGEFAPHGESALSGKDPSRIDRVGAYAARWAAKNVVAAGLARECEVQLSYAIGLVEPVSLRVDTRGTGVLADARIAARLAEVFDFRPAAIVRQFELRAWPARCDGRFYRRLAAHGHVGRLDMDLPWERTDRAGALR